MKHIKVFEEFKENLSLRNYLWVSLDNIESVQQLDEHDQKSVKEISDLEISEWGIAYYVGLKGNTKLSDLQEALDRYDSMNLKYRIFRYPDHPRILSFMVIIDLTKDNVLKFMKLNDNAINSHSWKYLSRNFPEEMQSLRGRMSGKKFNF